MKKSIFILLILLVLNSFCMATEEYEDIIDQNISGEIVTSDITDENASTENISGEENIIETELSDVQGNNKLGLILEIAILIFIIVKTLKNITESGSMFEVKPTEKMKYSKELPFEGITPGQAVIIKEMNLTNKIGNIFAASLMHLQFKGVIEITNKGDNDNLSSYFIKIINNNPNNLTAEEIPIYEFLVEYIDKFKKDDMTVSLAMLDKYILRSKEKTSKLKSRIEEAIIVCTPYFNLKEKENKRKKLLEILIYVACLVLMFIIHRFDFNIFTIHTWIMLLSILDIYLTLRIAKNSNILNQAGVNHRERLKALERYMLQFSTLRDRGVPELDIWNYYIIFALSFGISKKLIQEISANYPNIDSSDFYKNYLTCNALSNCNFGTGFMLTKKFKEET